MGIVREKFEAYDRTRNTNAKPSIDALGELLRAIVDELDPGKSKPESWRVIPRDCVQAWEPNWPAYSYAVVEAFTKKAVAFTNDLALADSWALQMSVDGHLQAGD